MEQATKPQIQKIQILISQLGLREHKKEMILGLTKGRTDSTKEISRDEATALIKHLAKFDPREKHIKAVLFLARKAGMVYGDTTDDFKMNMAKINAFLSTKGVVRKELLKMNLEELKKVHIQFEGIARNNTRANNNKEARQLTEELLNELQIFVQP